MGSGTFACGHELTPAFRLLFILQGAHKGHHDQEDEQSIVDLGIDN